MLAATLPSAFHSTIPFSAHRPPGLYVLPPPVENLGGTAQPAPRESGAAAPPRELLSVILSEIASMLKTQEASLWLVDQRGQVIEQYHAKLSRNGKADRVVKMSHDAGLVASKELNNPFANGEARRCLIIASRADGVVKCLMAITREGDPPYTSLEMICAKERAQELMTRVRATNLVSRPKPTSVVK